MIDLTTNRMLASFMSMLLSCMLFWTRFPSVHIAMEIGEFHDQETFGSYDFQFRAMILSGIIFQLFNFLCITFVHEKLSLSGVVLGTLDVVGAFFTAWMILDGLVWYSYHWIYWFCIMLPLMTNIMTMASAAVQQVWEVYGGFWGGVRMVLKNISETLMAPIEYIQRQFDPALHAH